MVVLPNCTVSDSLGRRVQTVSRCHLDLAGHQEGGESLEDCFSCSLVGKQT